MSHGHERKEKDCLNCGTIVQGRYCQVCGQENLHPKESFGTMVAHFFNDITHFDGKFFVTLKDLLFKPGFLSAEYSKGKRVMYLHPVRMYVFTSAIFFLVFFAINKPNIMGPSDEPFNSVRRQSEIKRVQKKLRSDSNNINLKAKLLLLQDTARELRPSQIMDYDDDFTVLGTINGDYKDKKNYDSMQASRPPEDRDGWFVRVWNKRSLEINDKYKYNRVSWMEKIGETILHRLPALLFVSLPFFALILKLLYIRRKQYWYTDHAIFSIHQYVFSLIMLLFVTLFDKFKDLTHWNIWGILMGLCMLLIGPGYLYIAMKKFYRQGKFKTFIKFLFLNLLGLIVLIILFGFFFLFSIFQV